MESFPGAEYIDFFVRVLMNHGLKTWVNCIPEIIHFRRVLDSQLMHQQSVDVIYAGIITSYPRSVGQHSLAPYWNKIRQANNHTLNALILNHKSRPHDSMFHFWKGLVHEGRSQYSKAMEYYDLAVEVG